MPGMISNFFSNIRRMAIAATSSLVFPSIKNLTFATLSNSVLTGHGHNTEMET